MRILIIEDDAKLSKVMKRQLEAEGYEADICDNGGDVWYYINQSGSSRAENSVYDLLILDRMLPVMDGLSVLAGLRKKGCTLPVIMVTALGELENRIEGLDCGADDYLVKPFAMEELTARIRALLRRPPKLVSAALLTFADLKLNLSAHTLSSPQHSCELSKKELALMECFMRSPEQLLAREVLITKVWGAGSEVSDGNLDNYISFLRRRLKTLESRAQLRTLHAAGYRLEERQNEA